MRCKYEMNLVKSAACSWPKRKLEAEVCIGFKTCTYQPGIDTRWIEEIDRTGHVSLNFNADVYCIKGRGSADLEGEFTLRQLKALVDYMEGKND